MALTRRPREDALTARVTTLEDSGPVELATRVTAVEGDVSDVQALPVITAAPVTVDSTSVTLAADLHAALVQLGLVEDVA